MVRPMITESMLSASMLTALSPSIARMYGAGDREGFRAQVDRIMRIMVAVFLPVFAVGIFWADALMLLVYGADYAAGGSLLVLLFAAVSCTSFNAATSRLSGTVAWGVKVLAPTVRASPWSSPRSTRWPRRSA